MIEKTFRDYLVARLKDDGVSDSKVVDEGVFYVQRLIEGQMESSVLGVRTKRVWQAKYPLRKGV